MGTAGWIPDAFGVVARGGTKVPPWVGVTLFLLWSCLMTYFAVREIRAWRRHRQFARGGRRGRRRYRVLVEAAVCGEVPVSGTGRCAIGFAAAPKEVRSFWLDTTRSTPDGTAWAVDAAGQEVDECDAVLDVGPRPAVVRAGGRGGAAVPRRDTVYIPVDGPWRVAIRFEFQWTGRKPKWADLIVDVRGRCADLTLPAEPVITNVSTRGHGFPVVPLNNARADRR